MSENNNKINQQNIPLQGDEPIEVKAKFLEANNKAISYIVSRMNDCCYNEVVNNTTIDSAFSFWAKIAKKYASQSIGTTWYPYKGTTWYPYKGTT
ncbi:hypothetical protein PCANC_28914 [Puccinia coronata f. sp. avenae]|uniref:Uncharacterized protein n=1 Tax=Puccinia coronata f. sp. avenae TaxID=200324 RepID=A0A2N5RV17_9BASI|nr:hypothetical protein PCANC_28914 [Puccinia coronata f. sp. avenae]